MVLALAPLNWGTVTWLGVTIEWQLLFASFVFALASFTDWLDGHIARRDKIVTNFGAFADPVADKMLTMTAFIILVELDMAPSWVVAIIVCRELAVTGLRLIVVENDGEVISAAMPGKIKTVTQMFSIIFLLLNNFPFAQWGIPLGSILIYVCLFFTVYSGVDYFWHARGIFKHSM